MGKYAPPLEREGGREGEREITEDVDFIWVKQYTVIHEHAEEEEVGPITPPTRRRRGWASWPSAAAERERRG